MSPRHQPPPLEAAHRAIMAPPTRAGTGPPLPVALGTALPSGSTPFPADGGGSAICAPAAVHCLAVGLGWHPGLGSSSGAGVLEHVALHWVRAPVPSLSSSAGLWGLPPPQPVLFAFRYFLVLRAELTELRWRSVPGDSSTSIAARPATRPAQVPIQSAQVVTKRLGSLLIHFAPYYGDLATRKVSAVPSHYGDADSAVHSISESNLVPGSRDGGKMEMPARGLRG